MDKPIPAFPLPADFKDCPTPLIKNIADYFYGLDNYLRDLKASVNTTHQRLAFSSCKFARGEISPFLFARSLTQAEYALSDSIKDLSALTDSLTSSTNAFYALLGPVEDAPSVPAPVPAPVPSPDSPAVPFARQ